MEKNTNRLLETYTDLDGFFDMTLAQMELKKQGYDVEIKVDPTQPKNISDDFRRIVLSGALIDSKLEHLIFDEMKQDPRNW